MITGCEQGTWGRLLWRGPRLQSRCLANTEHPKNHTQATSCRDSLKNASVLRSACPSAFARTFSGTGALLPPLAALPLQALLVGLWTASFTACCTCLRLEIHLPPPSPSSQPAASFDGIFFLPALACSLLLSLPELGLFPSPNYSCRRADGRGSGFLTRWECASLYRH